MSDIESEDRASQTLPHWLAATINDVNEVDLNAPISAAIGNDYHALSEAYSSASTLESNASARNVYALTSAVLSMYMKDDDANDPFGPMMVMDGGRSPTTTDFLHKADVLALMADRSTHPLIKARCADVAWLLKRKLAACAQVAIDNYVDAVEGIRTAELPPAMLPERKDDHPHIKKLVTRALQVARGARKQNVRTTELHNVLSKLFYSALKAKWAVGAIWYGRLLLNSQTVPPAQIANRLEIMIDDENLDTWVHVSEDLWCLTAECYHHAHQKEDEARCLGNAAEVLVQHALSTTHSSMVRASFLANAIARLQGVSGKKERRSELKKLLREAQDGIQDEMSTFSREIDLKEIIDSTVESFRDIDIVDQIFSFAVIDKSRSIEQLRDAAAKEIAAHPLLSIFEATIHDREGKVVERAQGHAPGALNEGGIEHTIARHEQLRRQLVVAGAIEPARQIIIENLYVSDMLLLWLIAFSPFVPPELKETYARGFSRMFQGDRVGAVYILTPLLEASVRHVLKQHGVEVVNFDDATQTQEDKNISALLTDCRVEMDAIFGADNVANLDRIFLSRFGSHLRHAIAHGKLTDGDPFGPDAIYACWFIFHLCMVPLLPLRPRIKAAFDAAQG